jgi:hypothetical protein
MNFCLHFNYTFYNEQCCIIGHIHLVLYLYYEDQNIESCSFYSFFIKNKISKIYNEVTVKSHPLPL